MAEQFRPGLVKSKTKQNKKKTNEQIKQTNKYSMFKPESICLTPNYIKYCYSLNFVVNFVP